MVDVWLVAGGGSVVVVVTEMKQEPRSYMAEERGSVASRHRMGRGGAGYP